MTGSGLSDTIAQRVVYRLKREGFPFLHVDDVREVYGGGRLVDAAAQNAIETELRELGFLQ